MIQNIQNQSIETIKINKIVKLEIKPNLFWLLH